MPSELSYAAYLLRLRKFQDGRRATWVASVQSIATGEQRTFSSVEALATFLLAQFPSSLRDEGFVPQEEATSATSVSR